MSEKDGIGHIYPSITADCINCGKCIKICPANGGVIFNSPLKAYASWAKDKQEHRTSSSGGIASCLVKKHIDNGGIVYGCASLPKGEIKHIRISTKEDANLLKGSKYVQSHLGLLFKQIKKDIESGKEVLFIGLPCQIAGLKKFIGKEDERLLTVDLVCHGVPSQKVLFEYLKAKGFERECLDEICFREQSGYYLSVIREGQTVYRKSREKDLFYMAFFDNLFFRDSCYKCNYATGKRCSDITLGDFWGLGKNTPFEYQTEGNVSLVLVNSSKGLQALNNCKDDVFVVERSLQEALDGNKNLRKPAKNNSFLFKKICAKFGLMNALRVCVWKRFIKNHIIFVYLYFKK